LGGNDEKKKDIAKEEIGKLCEKFTEKEKESIPKLLQEIFPLLEKVYTNISYPDWIIAGWCKGKRIASQKYFNRYFSYSVVKGEISDVWFEQFIFNVSIMSEEKIDSEIKIIIQDSSADNFIYKLRALEDDFEWKASQKLANVLAVNANIFPDDPQNHFFATQTSRAQLAIFIFHLIKKHDNTEEQLVFSKEIINKATPLEFAFDVLRWLKPNEQESNIIFTQEQIKEVWDVLLKRVLKIAGEKDIFEVFSDDEAYIVCKFWEGFDKDEFSQYIHKVIDANFQKSILLLKTYLPKFRAMGEEKDHNSDLEEKTYKYLSSILGKEYIANSLFKIYPESELKAQEVKWVGWQKEELSDFEIVRQFYHWYMLDDKNDNQ